MTRVTFGITSSPFLLSATLKKLFTITSRDFPVTTHRLATSFYVDDLVLTVNSIDDAIKLIIAKARVAPLKGNDSGDLLLPRLELTAAFINLWTDSKITLHWITGDAARWKTYVYNRVVEIQKLTKDSTWRHCAGYLNPADLLTRGVSANKLFTTEYWLKGPEFLSRVDYEWSTGNDLSVQIDESVLCANIVSDSKTEILEPIFPLENYEHLEKCLRVTAYVKRAFRVKNFPLALTSDELSDAEMY
ncbi:hypothetical protein ILUMI_03782 [Ignelater luminosus]|uniref:Reverse transcriptase domain-containing protein n=1 Tax=Ignelater luminosus TaxID=2038154 RepID=A0A8K0DA52_IGNLU|nr:hypothetical protein ILUMI_03782 [Ignelater luminosus]